jgi:triacylglycerol lipase
VHAARKLSALALAGALAACGDSARLATGRLAASGPPLTVEPAALAAALVCHAPLPDGARAVLLVHGTSVTPEENWEWNWQQALPHFGFVPCTVRLPDYAFVDIQESAEYVVHAIRVLSDATGRKVSVVGLSQGGLQPRWAIRWWPDIRERVDDLVMIVTTNHGAPFADASCAAPPCLPALWQQRAVGSAFLAALNAGDETPGAVSYTSIYSHADAVVQPSAPVAAAALEGAVNVAVQDLCPGRPVDHAQSSYDAAVWALGFDALAHEGPLDLARVDRAACLEFALPYADPEEAARRGAEIYLVAGERQSTYPGKVGEEPPLRDYARSQTP